MSQADDSDVAGALEGEQAVSLPRSFLVEASGPATVVRKRGDVVERSEAELSFSRRLVTLEEFAEFWTLRDLKHWKCNAIRAVLEDHEDVHIRYVIDDDQLDDWSVQVDGHAQAFVGAAETIVEGNVPPCEFDAPEQRFHATSRTQLAMALTR